MKYIILLLIIIGSGCKSSMPNKTIDEIAPENLLLTVEYWAYNSITIKDYKVEESC